MLIPASPLPLPAPIGAESSFGIASRVPPPARGDQSIPLVERPVTEPGRVEVIPFDRSQRAPVRMASNDGYARHALAAYEAIARLERRDGLNALAGIDDYA